MVERRAGHGGRFRLRLAPRSGSGHRLRILPGARADRKRAWISPPARCRSTNWASNRSGPQTLVVHLHAPTPYLLALLANTYLYPLYEPAVKQWGDALDAARPHGLERAIRAFRARPQRAHYSAQESALLGRQPRAPLEGELPRRRGLRQPAMNQYLAGDLDCTDRIPASDKDRLQADAGQPGRALPEFCDGDVRLSIWPSRLSPAIRSCAWRSAWPWTATFS